MSSDSDIKTPTGAAGRSTVKTFGLSHRDRAPLVFVETSRGSRADDTFFLICGPSGRAQELFRAAIAEFKRGSDIRPPEEYVGFLRETALGLEGGQLGQRLSFAAAWVRAGVCHWIAGGGYLLAQISKEGHVLRLPGTSGRLALGDMDRVVAAERSHFDDVEDWMRERREHGDLEAILHRLSQESRLGGVLVLEHRAVRGAPGSTPAGRAVASAAGRASFRATRHAAPVRAGYSRAAWAFGFAALAVAALIVLKWPLAGRRVRSGMEEVSEPREVSAVSLNTGAADSAATALSFKVKLSPGWTKKFTAAVTSSPRVAGGRVYFGCRDGRVYCLDSTSGREIWKCAVGSGVGASAAVEGGRVYVGTYDGSFWCIDASSGKALWRFKSGGKIVSSAAVASGSVLFGSYDRNLYCLSAGDGSLKWKLQTGGLVWSSPLVLKGRCYVGSADAAFYCALLSSGEVKWKYAAGGPVYASPAGGGPFVCCGSNSGAVYVLDAATGKEVSRSETGREVRSTFLVEGENAYAGADDGVVRCFRLSDGAAVWSFKTGGAIRSGAAYDDGLLFVTSYDGRLHVIDVLTGSEACSYDSGSQIYSSPAAAGNRVYFGTNDGDLVCLQAARES